MQLNWCYPRAHCVITRGLIQGRSKHKGVEWGGEEPVSQGMHAALESQREGRNGFLKFGSWKNSNLPWFSTSDLHNPNPKKSELSYTSNFVAAGHGSLRALLCKYKESKPRLKTPNTMKKDAFDSHFERVLSFMAPWSSSCNCAARETALQEEPRARSNSRDCSDLHLPRPHLLSFTAC